MLLLDRLLLLNSFLVTFQYSHYKSKEFNSMFQIKHNIEKQAFIFWKLVRCRCLMVTIGFFLLRWKRENESSGDRYAPFHSIYYVLAGIHLIEPYGSWIVVFCIGGSSTFWTQLPPWIFFEKENTLWFEIMSDANEMIWRPFQFLWTSTTTCLRCSINSTAYLGGELDLKHIWNLDNISFVRLQMNSITWHAPLVIWSDSDQEINFYTVFSTPTS